LNSQDTPGLFREEVIEERAGRLEGEVGLAVPISWHAIGYLLLAAVVAAFAFLAQGSYSRVETVSGAVVLDRGIASILPSRPGIVVALAVKEGQTVRAGALLAQIKAEESSPLGGTASDRIIHSLSDQERELASQQALVLRAADSETSRLASQIDGLEKEISELDTQIKQQDRLVALAERRFDDLRRVAGKGFLSRTTLEEAEGLLVSRRQQRSQLEQLRSGKSADLAQARRSVSGAVSTARAQAAQVASSRAQLSQQLAEAQSARGYNLTSPVDGEVTALTARMGQAVSPGQEIMLIAPAGGRPRVELYVPTRAIGFLAPGQEVRLAVDAFPYERFGTIEARISDISSTAVERRGAAGESAPVYLVHADLARPWMDAFGRRMPLRSGMTLTARIVLERQSLFEWLFEPLFAVGRR
jgi:membrane fusion protein